MNIDSEQIKELRKVFSEKERVDTKWELLKESIEDFIIKETMLHPTRKRIALTMNDLSDNEFSLRVVEELRSRGFTCYKSGKYIALNFND